jgi:hypothetical protein
VLPEVGDAEDAVDAVECRLDGGRFVEVSFDELRAELAQRLRGGRGGVAGEGAHGVPATGEEVAGHAPSLRTGRSENEDGFLAGHDGDVLSL